MPEAESPKPRRRRSRVSRKRQISKRPTGSKLWVADEQIFDEFVKRKHTTPAELLRTIVHEWATTMRVSGQAKDTTDAAAPIRKLHQQIIAEEIAPLRDSLAAIQALFTDENSPWVLAISNTPDSAMLAMLQTLAEELKATKEELATLRAFATAHYLLSGQSFATTWAVLNFLQRYLVEPTLKRDSKQPQKALEIATTERDDARREGLTLVEQMNIEFGYPERYESILITPESEA
jgi:hypothetical protein